VKVRPGSDFRPSRDGPWPTVETHGQLAPAEREWFHTNGAGAYAMSTISLMHTRRHHGVLVAALPPPLGRHVIMSHAETSLTISSERRTHRISTHQFPNVAPTPGYRTLASFSLHPLPRWLFKFGQHTLERTMCLVRGKNALIICYKLIGPSPGVLHVRPLMPMRPAEGLVQEHGGMMQVLSLKPGAVEMRPVPELPTIVFGHTGMFMGSPDWWRRFEYLADRSDGIPFQEDIWTPGVFEFHLEPGRAAHLVVAVNQLPTGAPAELMDQAARAILSEDPGDERPASVRALSVAASEFCLEHSSRPAVIAGFPWHSLLLRDWVMAMPGLYLARDRLDLFEPALNTLLSAQRGGLLPERLPEAGARRSKPLPDATLWLFELARLLEEHSGIDHPLLRERLYPALVRAFARVRSRRRRYIWLSPDGLVATGETGLAFTWMDARVGAHPITPRAGLAVEHQALWARGSETLARLADAYGYPALAACARDSAVRARAAFRARFWCHETDYPYDCLSEARDSTEAWGDTSIRPNALIALSIDPELFAPWQAQAVLERVRSDLLTPRGIRSLAPGDRRYVPQFAGNSAEREVAYHQGTAWTHLLGFYVRAALRLAPDDMDVYYDLRALIEQAADDGLILRQVAQLADGDAPHRPRGCPVQAISVAELLRALVVDLDV
jgi:predicted glycogen debranching enzyme